jgi:DNA-binding MarR family transcriptional regulator
MARRTRAATGASRRPQEPAPLEKVSAAVAQWGRERPGHDAVLFEIVTGFTLIHQQVVAEFRTFAQTMLDMGEGDLRILLALRRSGPSYALSPVQLKRNLFVTAGAITKQITRLEKRGLVERTSHQTSKRSIVVHLTRKGATLVDSVLERHHVFPMFEKAFYGLSPEDQETGRTFLRRLMGKLETGRRRESAA